MTKRLAIISVLVAVVVATNLRKRTFSARRQTSGQDCGGHGDVVFILDSSDSVGQTNFEKEKSFVHNVVNKWNIGPNGMQVGVVTVSTTAHNQFYPNQHKTKTDLLNALGRMHFSGGLTNTAEALKFAYENSFRPMHGGRGKSPHTIIIVTNNPSTSSDLTLLEAKAAKDNDVGIFTVGVGGGVDHKELDEVSSNPNVRYSMYSDGFESLNSLSDVLAMKTCNEISPDANFLPAPTGCLKQADVVFLVDSSTSVGASNMQKVHDFIKQFVKSSHVAPDGVHVGVVQYSSFPSVDIPLFKYTTRPSLMHAINQISYSGGATNTADALKFTRENIFSRRSDARKNTPKIAILITDGRSSDPAKTAQAAGDVHGAGIGVITVGVGPGADQTELGRIAGDSANMFTVSNYDQLNTEVKNIMQAACRVMASLPTAAPGGTLSTDTCTDAITNCKRYLPSVCTQFKQWAQVNCQKYCSFCHSLTTKAPPRCTDKLSNCLSYGRQVCSQYGPWAKGNCRHFCGFCGGDVSSSGFYGKCYYKGKEYENGDTWEDGCDYQCFCEDGNSGKYSCYNKCPVYHDLPSGCTLVRKQGECCLQPQCHFSPTISTFSGSGLGNKDGKSVCLYQGKSYFQDQQWEVGCDYICICTQHTTGSYTCQDRCPKYNSLPSNCKLQQQPGECCSKPVCEFQQQQGSFTGSGSTSGAGLGLHPTEPPPCADKLDNCGSYGKKTCTDYPVWAKENCRKRCSLCDFGTPHPGPDDRCLYEGKSYSQSQEWKPDCGVKCTCENAAYGYSRCVNTCPTYNNLPPSCSQVKPAGQCCSTIKCSSGSFYSSTNNLNSIGNGGMIVGPSSGGGSGVYVSPTLPSGATAQPGTGGTGIQPPQIPGCLYNGGVYSQKQRWNDGCSQSCECIDESVGQYRCRPRCPTYSHVPVGCAFVTDPSDSCCKKPQCVGSGNAIPVFGTAIIGHGTVQPPSSGDLWTGFGSYTFRQTGSTVPAPTGMVTGSGGIGFCTYKGKVHFGGETWEDGCQYNCVCDDVTFGHYTCRDKCIVYNNIPARWCHLETDPSNTCCQIPVCDFKAPFSGFTGFATLTPTTAAYYLTTVPPTPNLPFCEYNGSHYNTGQMWYDGCSYKCECENAVKNQYRCLTRCPEYKNLPANCVKIPDPQDPSCCTIPNCSFQGATASTSGSALLPAIPTLPPSSVHVITSKHKPGFCTYKNMQYKQGEKWQDGCQFECVCEDGTTGDYRCSDKCPKFDVPAGCRLVDDFANPCCKVPRCDSTPTAKTTFGIPSTGVTYVPWTGPTKPVPTPGIGYCVYKNVQYQQGQSWQDGCDLKCRCDNADKGIYTCNQRCPSFDTNLPPQCKMVTDSKDPCCLVPDCSFPVPTGSNIGHGTPTPVGGGHPTPPHIGPTHAPTANLYTSILPTPVPTQTLRPAIITGSAIAPSPTPGLDGSTPVPIVIRYCEYKGVQYNQGEQWNDGCDYACECTDALSGKYVCKERCPRFVNSRPECRLVKDPLNPCCKKLECISPPTPGVPPGKNTPTPIPIGQSPSPGVTRPGQTPQTGTPSSQPSPSPTPKDVCVYKGDPYSQGQSWYDGCDYKCLCESGSQGAYRCNNRCPDYPSMPKECFYVADPNDPLCCKKPQCNFNPSISNATGYVVLPTPPRPVIVGGIATPTPSQPSPYVTPEFTMPGGSPTPYPGYTPLGYSPTTGPTPIPKNVCVYKGNQYKQDQRWQDGCDYDCTCVDSNKGVYKCTGKCPTFNDLPQNCRLVRDYLNPCCQKPFCDSVVPTPPTTTIPGQSANTPLPQTTLAPTPQSQDFCVYNGVQFRQGASWKDGCDLTCTCENAKTGYYRCNQRCPRYDNLQSSCTLETDPHDSCCKVPVCSPQLMSTHSPLTPVPGSTLAPNPNATPGQNPVSPTLPTYQVPVPVPTGVVTGIGSKPVGSAPGCIYNGVTYRQGKTWQDGCTYNCTCIDEQKGDYQCTPRCREYSNIPAYCSLLIDPNDACCKTARCSPPVPVTASPAPQLTNAQHSPITVTTQRPVLVSGHTVPAFTPGLPATNTPVPHPKDVCVFMGIPYTQGQQFYDGCDKVCVCEDAKTGFYRCNDRCTKYDSIPSTCTMIADPKDPQCCQVPQCIQVPSINGQPTPGPSAVPTVVTNLPTGSVTGLGPIPTPTPDINGKTPQPRTGCQYKGATYVQGQKWQDGCEYKCICEDGITGQYKCDQRCPNPPNLPPQCKMVQDSKDYCCSVPVCDYTKPVATPGPIPIPNQNPTPLTFLTPSPGATYPPGFTPTAGPTTHQNHNNPPVPTPLAFCIYNGIPYKQGQTWNVGCKQKCRCDDAMNDIYNCFDRCPVYQPQPGCTMLTDPNDPCCQIPQCTAIPTPSNQHTGPTPPIGTGPTPVPGTGPTPPAGHTPQPSPVPIAPSPAQIIGQRPSPSVPGLTPIPSNQFCVYKGLRYKTGQKWQDGCDYDCVCIDDITGMYKCTQRCLPFPSPPPYCVMIQDPDNSCCRIPSCPNSPQNSPTPGVVITPPVGHTFPPHHTPVVNPSVNPTPIPSPVVPKDVCVYKGKAYTQGQKWDDGCAQVCVCENSMTGYYTCTDRCPVYKNIAPNCVMVPDSKDPLCCKAPDCNNGNVNIPVPLYGTITGNQTPSPKMQTPAPPLGPTPSPGTGPTPSPGTGPTPSPGTGPTPSPGTGPTPPALPKDVCVYKGVTYKSGQKWQDGCDYDCVCTDGVTGHYECTDKCPRYPNLPLNCRMVYDPLNPCCQKPACGAVLPPTPLVGVTPVPNTALPGHTPKQQPNPSATPYPGGLPTPQFCVYNGVPFLQGKSWNVGCDKVCRCEDAAAKLVNCDDRCAHFKTIQPGCTLTTDPDDQCCQVLQCPINTNNPNQTTGSYGTKTGQSIPPSNSNPQATGNRDVCTYQGKSYQQGQTWEDGCTYNCVCVDANAGKYECTDKCAKYPSLPPTCTLVNDPNNKCCQKPYCPDLVPTPAPHLTPVPGVSGQSPGVTVVTVGPQTGSPISGNRKDECVYNGVSYKQGQQWYDGCSRKCVCEDSIMNVYRCQERCPTYQTPPSSCKLVPDPQDPTCCKIPECPLPTPVPGAHPTPGFVIVPTVPSGVITGNGPVPTVPPGKTPPPGSIFLTPQPGTGITGALPKKGCLYKGAAYTQGAIWDDGCDYRCECVDDVTGGYNCTAKCQKYGNLPNNCVLLKDPKNPCCMAPYCDFLNPTPFPNGIPTPNPLFTPSPLPNGEIPTPGGNIGGQYPSGPTGQQGFCVYNGVYYRQNGQWNVGCEKTCRCDDVSTGYYTCTERCPAFKNISPTCTLKTSPTDLCCLVPDCNVYPGTGSGVSGTNIPGQTDKPGGFTGTGTPTSVTPVDVKGTYTGSSGNNPGNPGTSGFGSGSRTSCVYKGKAYNQGETFNDGCLYKCECVDASRGKYTCTDRCPVYYFLPSDCIYETDPTDSCCKVAKCGVSPKPTGPSTTKHFGIVTAHCIYHKDGSWHDQGDIWNDGCMLTCRCEDARKNLYKCDQRCPAYSSLPSYCTLVPDTTDRCCKIPLCKGIDILTGNNLPTASPTLSPTVQNILPLGTHSVFTGTSGPRPGTGPGTINGQRTTCVYKSVEYKEHETWNDGCDYVCQCLDGIKGLYKCTSKCPKFPPLPSYCQKVSVPGECCQSLTCNVPHKGIYTPDPGLVPQPLPTPLPHGQIPTTKPTDVQLIVSAPGSTFTGGSHLPGNGAPVPQGQTVSGLRGICVYKGKMYQQGETWEDGCDYKCQCFDARSGYYKCDPKCPKYDSLPSSCYTVKSPTGCCETPVCRRPDGSTIRPDLMPNIVPGVFGAYTGGYTGFRPGYLTGTHNVFSGQSSVCVYKSKVYHQGEKWDDGCDYTCECKDANKRQYVCTPKCPSYTSLPPSCRLEKAGGCCKKVNCNPLSTTAAPCVDAINNCDAYGHGACKGTYEQWAHINCQAFCGFCTTQQPPTNCKDKIDNCAVFGQQSCSGVYLKWAKENCMRTCNLCPTEAPHQATSVSSSVPHSSASPCRDRLQNCADYGSQSCKEPYLEWAKMNCKATCGICGGTTTAPPQIIANPDGGSVGAISGGFSGTGKPGTLVTGVIGVWGATGEPGWTILMKGVAGVPGDLYNLWVGSKTLNTNEPKAWDLTNTFKGHYKPDASNHWDTCKFDQIKLSIYKEGKEKANIVFNAKGATKMNWMEPSRIISSTFSDIKNAPHDIFSIRGDTNFGREFYASSANHGGCDTSGWMMVSTQGGCFYESQAHQPAFYYSTTGTSIRWGAGIPGEGDVMVIMGHGGHCGPNNTNSQELKCLYKGKSYSTGDNWQDGCEYNCTCVDEQTNFYKCNQLCPVINVPSNCVLVKKPGSCCATAQCNVTHDSCYYKGTTYKQDETWSDGCDYNCKCEDGSRGFFQCKTKCLQWNLPDECHLESPPSGMCCPVPTCPAGYIINYPPGYKQE